MNIVMQFFRGGGIMMYPLILCSIALITVAIERGITLRKASIDGDALFDEIKKILSQDAGATEKARQIALSYGGPLGRMFARGLKNAGRPADAIEMAMEQEAANEQPALEANLIVLRTVVNISPLLGLLGTIAGMIASFRAASQLGLSNPTQILGGIAEALISTASGITLAVLGFLFYNYYSNATRKILEDLEYYGAELVNFLTGRFE